MDTVVAPAKLTLSLRITGVDAKGMHLIDAEMVTVDLFDTLHIESSDHSQLSMVGAGADVPVDDDNLVIRALTLAGTTAAVSLEKRIPSQAGLGGGSADAAAALRWAGFDDVERAASIGADVAFCLVGGRARVTGIGEIVEPAPYEERLFTLATPPIACPTPAVYRAWDDLGGPTNSAGDNDLEPAALAIAPGLATARDELWAVAGRRPSLAGSGSTWFVPGAFPGDGRRVVRTTPASPVA